MIKNHDARSLGKYIGNEIFWNDLGEFRPVGTLTGVATYSISMDNAHFDFKEKFPLHHQFLPLLKDYTQLKVPMLHEGVEILPILYIYKPGWITFAKDQIKNPDSGIVIFDSPLDDFFDTSFCLANSNISIEIIQKLQALGFGAIKCDESPTGYRDLWHNPCVLDEGK